MDIKYQTEMSVHGQRTESEIENVKTYLLTDNDKRETGEELTQVTGGRPNGLGPEFGCEAGEFVADAYKEASYSYKDSL